MAITDNLRAYIRNININNYDLDKFYDEAMIIADEIDKEYEVKCDRLERYRAAVSSTFSTPLVPQMNSIEEILVNKIVDAATERKNAIAANDIHQYNCDIRELTNLIFIYINLLIEFRDCKG